MRNFRVEDFDMEVGKYIKNTTKWSVAVTIIGTGISLGFIGVALWLIVKAVA